MPKEILSQSELKELFDYDYETGVLTWRNRPCEHFKTRDAFRTWNTRFSGKSAGCLRPDGYLSVGINYAQFQVHRIIYKIIHGTEPPQIDHKNHIRHDNWQDNLRAATQQINGKNQKRPSNNKSGITGVIWNKRKGKWQAYIRAGGKNIYLGLFEDIENAISARHSAEIKYGFHENHGRN